MAKSLLDTDIFSEILKNKHPVVSARAAQYLQVHGQFTLSAPTVTEVVCGYQQAQRLTLLPAFRKAITQAEVHSLGTPEADLAGQSWVT